MFDGQAGLGTEHFERPGIAVVDLFVGDEIVGDDHSQGPVRGIERDDYEAVLIEGRDKIFRDIDIGISPIDQNTSLNEPAVYLLGLGPEYEESFDSMVDRQGRELSLQGLEDRDVYINTELAENLERVFPRVGLLSFVEQFGLDILPGAPDVGRE